MATKCQSDGKQDFNPLKIIAKKVNFTKEKLKEKAAYHLFYLYHNNIYIYIKFILKSHANEQST